MKKGEHITLAIERLAPDGAGTGAVKGRMIPVKGTVPGDVVEVRIDRLKRTSARVTLCSFIEQGIDRVQADCPHFDYCGGCRWQNVPYDTQCNLKAGIVKDQLSDYIDPGMLNGLSVEPSPDEFCYRNKMEFSFDRPPGAPKPFLGLHEYGRYDKVFDITDCFLQSPVSNRILAAARAFTIQHDLSIYGLKSHRGLLRYLSVRDSKKTGEVMVNLVTSEDPFLHAGDFCAYLRGEVPEITTIIRSINSGVASVAVGESREVLYGSGTINEGIGTYTFTISPDSFFQTNPRQAKHLYDAIREFCKLTGSERVLDLYCGTGTIGIYLADKADAVVGIEVVEDAVCDARRNAELNGVENISFVAGQVEHTVHESMHDFDVLVCDPPRAGIHPRAMRELVKMRVPRFIYVSCTINALPGDLELLKLAGYKISDIRVFDMSPHTPHIETVLLLEL